MSYWESLAINQLRLFRYEVLDSVSVLFPLYDIIACNINTHSGEHIDYGCTNGSGTVTSA